MTLDQHFSTARLRPCTGPWHQYYQAVRGCPGICHFSFLSIFFMNKYFIVEKILRRIIFVNVSKNPDPECLNNICVASVSDLAAYFLNMELFMIDREISDTEIFQYSGKGIPLFMTGHKNCLQADYNNGRSIFCSRN